ncbi:flavin reductase family protein [Rhizobium lusitanum]|uniref:Flavin reductase family protein n=1 Tax=Rhizobium lusitanum TaxID=293958 RepID=A0A6L9UL37_9HYPH|nr:flavin reductase family protein [Rhizobium lusitanum]NEI74550.1 flavin reductase family protein [Rhizobium lusitanum]
MEIDPAIFDTAEMNFLLTSLVVPRAIGWISTISKEGIANLSPFSFFTVASTAPPHLLFSSASDTKDSVVNARETGEFVVNITDQSLLDVIVGSSAAVAPSVDEFELVGLERAPSVKVAAPRVARAKAHFECRLADIVTVGTSSLVIGEIIHLHCDPSIWSDGRVQPDLLRPLARLGGSKYASLGEIFSLPAPTIDERG